MFFFQRSFLYQPDKAQSRIDNTRIAGKIQELVYLVDGTQRVSWYVPPETGRSVIVHMHGNAGNLNESADALAPLVDIGYGIALVDFRGYNGGAGKPTEEGLYADTRAVINILLHQMKIPLDQLIFIGQSLGSGVAVQMAIEYQPPKLILDVPFSSASYVGKARYPYLPVDLLMLDKFENDKKIQGYEGKTLIIVAGADKVIPPQSARDLYVVTPDPKEMIEVASAEHIDAFDAALLSVIDFLND